MKPQKKKGKKEEFSAPLPSPIKCVVYCKKEFL